MNRIAMIYLAVVALCAPLASAQADEEPKVRQAFQAYRTALLDQDGKAAWEAIDFHTQNYYTAMAKNAVSLDREGVGRLDLVTRLSLLRLRVEFNKAQLEAFTGSTLFAVMINNGWISKSTLLEVPRMPKVVIDRNLARGSIPAAPDTPALPFIKEGDQWKFALWKIFQVANIQMKQMIDQSGQSENDFIKAILEQISSRQVDDRIWDGPLK